LLGSEAPGQASLQAALFTTYDRADERLRARRAQHLESQFLQLVDSDAAIALKRLLGIDLDNWTARQKNGWSRFLMSLLILEGDAASSKEAVLAGIAGFRNEPGAYLNPRAPIPGRTADERIPVTGVLSAFEPSHHLARPRPAAVDYIFGLAGNTTLDALVAECVLRRFVTCLMTVLTSVPFGVRAARRIATTTAPTVRN
jgi:hypothetical protein